MATRIATIAAHVTAQDRGFNATMSRVREDAKKTKSALDSLQSGGTLGGNASDSNSFVKAFAVGGSVYAGLQAVNFIMGQANKALKEIADQRDRLEQSSDSASVLGLSFQELQALNVAATLANVSIDKTDDVVGKLVKTISAAAEGSDEAESALKKVGLSVDSFRGRSTYESLMLVADGLNSVSTVGDRVSAASQIFGRELGPKMATVLDGGSAALKSYTSRAQELGLVLTDQEIAIAKHRNTLLDLQRLKESAADMRTATDPYAAELEGKMATYGSVLKEAYNNTKKFAIGSYTMYTRLWEMGFDKEMFDGYNRALSTVQRNVEETMYLQSKKASAPKSVVDFIAEADSKKVEEHKRLMQQWKEEHDKWLQDFYSSSFENFASQPGLGGGNTPVWMGMSLNDMKQAYEMQQKMAEWDKAIQDGNERDLIAADQARRDKEKEAARIAEEARYKMAPLLISGSAEAQRAGYLSQMQDKGVAVDSAATSQAARDKENLRLQREQTRILKQIENNTTQRASGGVGV